MSLDNIEVHERSDMNDCSWLPDHSYVLTARGWRPLWAISKGDMVLASNYTGVLSLQQVKEVKYDTQRLVKSSHSFWEFVTGEQHKWLGYRRMTKADNTRVHIYDHKICTNTTKEFHIRNCGVYGGGFSDVSEDECRVLGWLLADGYIKWEDVSFGPSTSHGTKRGVTAQITQNDNKYGEEIKTLLIDTGAYSRETLRKNTVNVCRDYYLHPAWFRDYWRKLGFQELDKHSIDVVGFLLKQPKKNIEAFLDAFYKADGHTTRKGLGTKVITQNQNNLSEGVIVAGYLLGYNITSGEKGGIYTNKRGDINICKWYKLGEKPHQTTMRIKTEVTAQDEVVQLALDGYAIYRQEDVVTCA